MRFALSAGFTALVFVEELKGKRKATLMDWGGDNAVELLHRSGDFREHGVVGEVGDGAWDCSRE